MQEKIIYLAGPMRGIEWYNFYAFEEVESALATRGPANIINPHEEDLKYRFDVLALESTHDWNEYPPSFDKDMCYQRCFEAVCKCDTIVLLPGWKKSKGARAEKAIAEWQGKQVRYAHKLGSGWVFDLTSNVSSEDKTEPESPRGNPENKGVEGGKPSNTENPKDAIGAGKLPLHLWPTTATMMGGIGLLNGMLKYGRSNWRAAGVRASIYYDACHRHLDAWFEGEDIDPDDNVPHLAAALACIAIIVDAQAAGKLNDDRNVAGGYRKLRDQLSPLVAMLKEKHKDKNPKHYTLGTEI